mmetsp:Transcript_50104/g.131772  ORF Transcript_50104/g.131772 Transcript_50104/m.131772 type:complete len:94 (-) Transcript_50104:22-303(-)
MSGTSPPFFASTTSRTAPSRAYTLHSPEEWGGNRNGRKGDKGNKKGKQQNRAKELWKSRAKQKQANKRRIVEPSGRRAQRAKQQGIGKEEMET